MEINPKEIKSIPATFCELSLERGDKVAMRHKEYGLWHEITWNEYYQNSAYVAHALISMGIEPGSFVGIIGENCPEWLYFDIGIQMAGARTVGIYATNSWQQLQFILDHAECQILFAENEEQVDKWLMIRDKTPGIQYVIYWDKKGLERLHDPQLIYYDDFIAVGKESFSKDPDLHHHRIQNILPSDIAILVYTSGTTGNPKGVMLTSENLLWTASTLKVTNSQYLHQGDETMSFLPLCHIYERMFSAYQHLTTGYTINFAESMETISQNLTEIRPTIGYAVPRVWEKFQSSILIRMADAPWLNRKAFALATKIGYRYYDRTTSGEGISPLLRIARFLAYWLVLYPLKYMIGMNRMRSAISGAAPISPTLLRFYHVLGIPITEAYGMTETSCIISFSTPDMYKLGTVGKPIIPDSVRLSEEGEIMVRHPGVTIGYYKNPEATNEAFTGDWLHTGDLGEIDDDGFLRIVDRKKDLIITAGGKNIAPQKIESMLKFSPYINDAVVIGDKRKYISAIIVLDEENINKYARDQKISYTAYSDLAKNAEIRKLIDQEVDQVNKSLARVETIRKFTILEKRLYVEDGEVTPTMKVKRKFINNQFREEIESMYN